MYPPAKHMFAYAISSAVLVLAIICPLMIKQTEAGGGKGKAQDKLMLKLQQIASQAAEVTSLSRTKLRATKARKSPTYIAYMLVRFAQLPRTESPTNIKLNTHDASLPLVPVYMPIPIPIPMPVGPHPPPPPAPHHSHGEGHSKMFQHPHAFGQDDEGEGEVRKIYLLQPIPRARPQPHLKGGGLMGPIQNHIHLSPHDQFTSSGKYRHAGGQGGGHQLEQQSLREGDPDLRPQDKQGGIKSASSDVKILPIVVIPPVAPMPPIQLPSSQSNSNTHRLMFSPQFNNFLVTNDRTKRRQRHNSFSRGAGDTFAEYGGSVGGSVFRDNFIGRGRPARSQTQMSMGDGPNHHDASPSRSRDFDYGDSDYENQQATVTQSAYRRSYDEPHTQLARRRHHRMTLSGSFPMQRRYQRQFMPQAGGDLNRHKSIRDIIEAQKASRFEDYDQAVNTDQQADYFGSDNEAIALSESQSRALSNLRLGRNQSPASFEISLDDLSNQLALADSQQQNRLQRIPSMANNQDLSSLYYDHGDLASSSSKVASKSSDLPQSIGLPERDIFEDDQWRFDSIKSVKHVAVNATMIPASNLTSSISSQVQGPAITSMSRRTKLKPTTLENVRGSNLGV